MRGTWQESYREWADAMKPKLRAALDGEQKVPPQKPFVETWLGLALHYSEGLVSLWEVIESADALNHGIPNPDEVSWAFLCLRTRGWLAVQGESYGLTPEGRIAIGTIISQGNIERLNDWISTHPPLGPVTKMDVYLSLGKKPRSDSKAPSEG